MSAFLRAWAILMVALKRLISQPGLALTALLGIVLTLSLIISIPIYSDSVYLRLFQENVLTLANENSGRSRPPLSLIFSFEGTQYGEKQLEEVVPADTYLTQQAIPTLGLPQETLTRYFVTAPYQLFPKDETNFSNSQRGLEWVSFATVGEIEKHIALVDGSLPAASNDEMINVLVSEALATQLGLQTGEKYVAFRRYETREGETAISQLPVRIAGIWKATDPQEQYWLYGPEFLEKRLLVPETLFSQEISKRLDDEISLALWYLILDDAYLRYQSAIPLIYRITAVAQQANMLLPNLKLISSPIEALRVYSANVNLLTFQLYAYSFPVLGLLLAFIGLSSSLYVEQRRNEIAVLRSRGATILQILAFALVEGLVLAGLGLVLSLPFGLEVGQLIGHTRRFLDFGSSIVLPTHLTDTALKFGAVTVAMIVMFQLIPAQSAARHTVISYKQERARLLRRPWWQSLGLDILLFILAIYAAYTLRQQGSIDLLGAHNPFENPLLFLVPALFIFAVTLFLIRVMPLFMGFLAWAASHTSSVGFLMASRYLARSPGFYVTPLILLVLTLSLSTYIASLAQTVDTHLYEKVYYEIGSDLRFLDTGERSSSGPSIQGIGEPDSSSFQGQEPPEQTWLFLPVSEYIKIPGVIAASPVGRYTASASFAGEQPQGTFLGINRVDFPVVSFWRRDFATTSLGALMNQLAQYPDGVLIPRSLMDRYNLSIGDNIRLKVNTYGQNNDLGLRIVGDFKLFPSWYPEDGPLFVGNLDYLFEKAGTQFPYRVWIKTDPNSDDRQVIEQFATQYHIPQTLWQAARLRVNDESQRPERQGLFGVLSVGFVAAATLTVLGFLLYAIFSFHRRFVEFGVLRANGLSAGQMTSFLAWELAFLILIGGAIGTWLGVGVSQFFIPYLQVGDSVQSMILPYVVEIYWPAIVRIYILFVLLFVVGLVALISSLRRMKVFQAIKLGETI